MALYHHIALKTKLGDAPYIYLGVIDDKNSEKKGYLTYSTDAVLTPNAKFALENGPDGLVHIRSCRNNKYWARSSSDGYWIVAGVDEPVSDKTAWNCTLFKMSVEVAHYNLTTFFHVQSKTTVNVRNSTFLSVDPDSRMSVAVSILIDYDALVVLPPLVAFKGDNGLFYSNKCDIPKLCLGKFASDDIGDPNIVWSISTNNDGFISIQLHNDTHWWRVDYESLVYPYSVTQCLKLDEDSKDYNKFYPDRLFSVVKVDDNVIALRNLLYDKFCARGVASSTDINYSLKFEDVLTVSASNIIKEAYLQVIEPVFSRRVEVFEFDRDNARIYDVAPLSTIEAVFENPTNVEQTGQLDMRISTTKTSTWTNSINMQLGVKTTFQTGVPYIAKGKIEVSASATYGYQWQDSVQEMQQMGSVYTVKVPPMTRVVGQALATKGTCDVPFFYVQIDCLTNGKTLRKKLNDGVFTGVSAFNFSYKVSNFPISGEAKIRTLEEPNKEDFLSEQEMREMKTKQYPIFELNIVYTLCLAISSLCVLLLGLFVKNYLLQ